MKKQDGDDAADDEGQQQVDIKIDDEILKGVYANNTFISHTKEEFVLDFINILPPQGVVTARVICSPGHIKRLVNSLAENLRQYEEEFGEIAESAAPQNGSVIN